MKTLQIIAFFLILAHVSFGQTDTIKFKQFGDSSKFSELHLNPDKTFEYHHYNIRSCWTWYSVCGTWTTNNSKIIFTDTIHWEEDLIRLDTSANNSDYVLLTIKNDYGKPLKKIKVKYSLLWSKSADTYVSDSRGQIRISKNLIAKQRQKEYSGNNVQLTIYFSNKKSPECSMSTSLDTAYDQLDITIVDNPKEELIIRTTTYRIDGNNLYFVSQTYTGNKGYVEQFWGNFRATNERVTMNNN